MANWSFVNRAINGVKKHSPKILFGLGVTLSVVGTVVACIQTTKAEEIIDEHNRELEEIEKAKEIAKPEEYTETDIRKDQIIVYGKTFGKLVRLYWLAELLGVLSFLSLLFGFKILNKRLASTIAALTTTLCSYNAYRERVIEDQGPEKDRQYILGSTVEEKAIEEKVTDPETGKEKVIKKDKEIIDINLGSIATTGYFVFSEFNPSGNRNNEWDRNINVVLDTLRAKQNYWCERLEWVGKYEHRPLSLNEVIVDCGGDWKDEQQIIGWKWEPGKRVDFGLDEITPDHIKQYLNGDIDCLVLHFNIDKTPIIGVTKKD